ncbi:MAG: PAS domain-containing protein [Melioribacteraceae bacterium]|nr:PAS domain-containing protein [Melioribacteraceae bacterium]
MSEKFTKSKNRPDQLSRLFSVLIDKNGKIIALNNSFKKYFPSANPNNNLFDLFDNESFESLQKLFIESRKNEIAVEERIRFKEETGSQTFIVKITPLRSENNIYFIVQFDDETKSALTNEVTSLWVSSDIDDVIKNPGFLNIINKIKSSYPFSFIEKAKIQKDINAIDEFFWLKETSGKIVIVNEKFANWLGNKPSQLEGRSEEELLPKAVNSLVKNNANYIDESKNIIVVENISNQLFGIEKENLSLIQFPMLDIDNQTIAIISVTSEIPRKIDNKTEYKFLLPPVKNLPFAAAIISIDNKIISFNKVLLHLFKLNEKIDLVGQDISKVFEKGILQLVEQLSVSGEKEIVSKYKFTEKINSEADIVLSKLQDFNDNLYAIQITLVPSAESNFETESKAKLYDVLNESMPAPMFIYDIENLKFLEVNEAALKFYGYKKSDFLNMDLTDLYAPEDIQTLIESGSSSLGNYSGPWKHKTSDGNSVYVQLSRFDVEFNNKKAHLNIIGNLSEHAEERKKFQILEAVYENSSDPVVLTDKDGFIISINDVVTKKLGYSKKDLENVSFITLLADDDRVNVNRNIFNAGLFKTTTIEVELKNSTGSFNKAQIVSTPIKNVNGEIESFNLILKLQNLQTEVKDVAHTQESILGKVDPPFLSNVFHEILTPINVILGFTQEIEESIENPNDEQKEALEIIKENQKLLLQIMDNAVEYSTLQQKVIKFRSEQIKFVDLLNEIKENVRKAAESKKIEFIIGRVSSTLTIETDKQKFISLISLFLKFAIQITKEESITLSANAVDDKNWIISVKDSKDKISQYLLKSLNEVFFEDELMSRRNYGFSRFSVKLAKKLLELLSAKKEIISKGDDEIEYGLLFPIKFIVPEDQEVTIENVKKDNIKALTEQPKIVIEEVPKIAITVPKAESTTLDIPKLSCLYLEDQVDSQILFKSQMKDLKSIEFSPSFENALPLLKTKKFDFIVMDINLQGEYNGLDALRIIQKMPGYKDVPIIASTAYVQSDARDSFVAAGFTDFISKPLLRAKILEVLKKLF